MKFSKHFLNKLLNSAIKFHNLEQEGKIIPIKLQNSEEGINYFINALKFEANKSLQTEIIIDSPLLHAVNLGTKNPGIVSDKNDKKLIIHRAKKEIKPKTDEQLLKELERQHERKIQREKKKIDKEIEKEIEKEEKKSLKEDTKELNNLDKTIKKKTKKKTEVVKKRENLPDDHKNISKLNNKILSLENEISEINEEYANKKSINNEKQLVYDNKKK